MAKLFTSITDELQRFIEAQHLFFVATAPLGIDGHVNLSPKGLESLRVLSPHQVAYLDLTGSGNETSAHLQENRRITFLFCAFTEPACILRLYGQGQTILPNHPDWNDLATHFPDLPGTRQIIIATIHRVQTSCGLGVPLYEYQGQRQSLINWADKKGVEGVKTYQQNKNCFSLDGLPTPLEMLTREPLLSHPN